MSEKEINELRRVLIDTPHEQLVDTFIKLRRLYIRVCGKCNQLDEELERIRDTKTYLKELIDDLDE